MRALHDASFIDDPTRLLRLVRYASRLDSQSSPTRGSSRKPPWPRTSGDDQRSRLGAELRLLAREPDPVAAVSALGAGIDAVLAPGFGLRDPEPARRALALLPMTEIRRCCDRRGVDGVCAGELTQMLERLRSRPTTDAILAAQWRNRLGLASGRPAAVGCGPRQWAPPAGGVALGRALGPANAARSWRSSCASCSSRSTVATCSSGVESVRRSARGCRAALAAKLDGLAQAAMPSSPKPSGPRRRRIA